MTRAFAGSAAGAALFLLLSGPLAAEVRRLVIIKVDGVPESVVERELARIDPVTHKSSLPWIDHVFSQGGTRLANFYVRAISLSAPSWSLLDTGQHLQIHGNAEFDRYTNHVYDYLNFFPFYVGYALSHRVDMPGVEVLDDAGIPLLIDRFPYQAVYQGFQLYQRGVRWKTLQHGLQHRFSHSLRELLDEWTIGFEAGSSLEEQTERDLIEKLADPGVRYLDYFTGDYDHVAHLSSDPAAQRMALQRIDGLVGRIWTAIEASPLGPQTVLVLVSDHGMNTEPGVYSQGYDLVSFFNSSAGGGQHVVTDRHPMTEYKLKGLDPFVSEVVTASDQSPYLKGASSQYPTVLLDLDGNERASVYLRNSNLNLLHILLRELQRSAMDPRVRRAAIGAFFQVVDRNRDRWQATVRDLQAVVAELNRRIEDQQARIKAQPGKWTAAERAAGLDKAARRLSAQLEAWRDQERGYTDYASALSKLLALTPADFEQRRLAPEDLIPKRAMGDANTVYDLQNYVVGPSTAGLAVTPDGSLDFARSFARRDYFPLLAGLSVRNNVQSGVGSHPVDFFAMRIAGSALPLAPGDATSEDAVWLYRNENRQALILSRHDAAGNLELRYLPVRGLRQDASGLFQFESADLAPGFPLELFEDSGLDVRDSEGAQWLNSWHSELDWFRAIHRTKYSNGLLALQEQFLRTQPPGPSDDSGLLGKFSAQKRQLAQPDFVMFASDHWNFNVRGFNPGGNHGSMLGGSTHSVLMLAGGSESGIPQHRVIEKPYDSLSLVPTLLELMGKDEDARKLPGRPISELLPGPGRQPLTP
ncbi:MAG TPA: alkaline phosphatase family protein [Bryobacteraceae bacterium]|nr:alkaline phosphatase family protein [Bryobacteraceae bacterium]